MENETLTLREHDVLETIVRNYILKAEPTGSRFISRQKEFDLSPATIRNIMSDLEERGFIAQPHTSAGRIPTDKGYRYYVDCLMKYVELPENAKTQIKNALTHARQSDLHILMETASRALAKATSQLGIILAPRLCKAIFRRVHTYPMDNGRFLLNLTIDSGFVKTMVVEFTTEVALTCLEDACQIINDRFFGKTLGDMCLVEKEAFSDTDLSDVGIIRLIIPPIKRMIAEEESDAVYAGETNMILQPEFADRHQVYTVIELLEEKKMLMHLFELPGATVGGVTISIGGENADGQLKSFSLVKTRYRVGSMEGELGVVGPKRMPYPFLVSAVEYTAKLLGEVYA